ncbi:nitroreductase family protein [Candidatus Shapirobacteria bacterium CG03_land_8_20_14_0_80_40_19]|uniref:Nitroreductase family protein n=1 Tax=Candidatus Shapirobacteria bacterium CG03_land_8_20_14_0_80_40_19 TaxID=1974880 RepID=A0A2M7BBT0_9BACT|nr:MAG: nitroreductase family protein [Candidatus Shapirobacteria bacterium CG03_land_8_20_14_0_80_40_19]
MSKDFLETILTRHSVRHFTGEPVSGDDLKKVLKAGMSAPSAVNTQPWAFIVVTKKKLLDLLCESLSYAKMLDKAGAAVIVCGVPDKDKDYASKFWVMDCSAATENILLAVHGLGLGAVWTAVYPDEEKIKAVREILKIPSEIIPLNVIPIGVPVGDERPKDKFKKENIHREIW